MLTAYNQIPIPSFMYGTAWKKEATKDDGLMSAFLVRWNVQGVSDRGWSHT